MSPDEADNTDPSKRPPVRVPWPPLILVGFILVSLALGGVVPLPIPVPEALGGAVRAIGMVLILAALAVDVWALLTLSRARTTVLPNAVSSALVTAGPFARSRNPIYAANVALLVGLGLALDNLWLLAGAVLAAILTERVVIVHEERHLEALFGQAYRDYTARVRRWL